MEIVSALFIQNFDIHQDPGQPASLDLQGVYFSVAAPESFPLALEPHLLILVRCPEDGTGVGALEVEFVRDGEQIARNVQPLQVEPGKFNYRLIRGELTWNEPGTIEARCRIGQGHVVVVPLTVNPT